MIIILLCLSAVSLKHFPYTWRHIHNSVENVYKVFTSGIGILHDNYTNRAVIYNIIPFKVAVWMDVVHPICNRRTVSAFRSADRNRNWYPQCVYITSMICCCSSLLEVTYFKAVQSKIELCGFVVQQQIRKDTFYKIQCFVVATSF